MNLVIATRGSRLARRQAESVRDALVRQHPGLAVRLEVVRTRGDTTRSPADELLQRGLFTSEIERAVAAGRAGLAVHSLKDLPTAPTGGLIIAAVPPREDPADCLVSPAGGLDDLPPGATVLTGSPRRRAQLLHRRPDLQVAAIRGNVPTRLARLDEGAGDALLLAVAGLARLGLSDRVTQRLDPTDFLPACGQGALALQIRSDDTETARLVAPLDDPSTRASVEAERAFLAELGAGCRAPAGAYVQACGTRMRIRGLVCDVDGRAPVRDELTVEPGDDPAQVGRTLARRLLDAGAAEILRQIRRPA